MSSSLWFSWAQACAQMLLRGGRVRRRGRARTTSAEYLVLFMLDADVAFGMGTDLALMLAFGGEVQEAILVGVGYGDVSVEEWGWLRGVDLTPSVDAGSEEMTRELNPDAPEVLSGEASASGHTDLPAEVFMSVGLLEEDPGIPESATAAMVTNVREMAERLNSRGYPGLHLTTHFFEGETHLSVIPLNLSWGLRTLYPGG